MAFAAGVRGAEQAFTRDGYVVHLGRSSLRALVEGQDRDNRYYDWASAHHEPHFAGEAEAPARYAAFLAAFTDEVGSPDNLVASCRRFTAAPP